MAARSWLKEIRSERMLNQSDVAALSGITSQMYSLIEKGKRQPSVRTAKAIAKLLRFRWVIFFDEDAK